MFDVIWTDPDRKCVGEHRAKKRAAKEQREKEEAASIRQSTSSSRRSSSSSEKPFGLFASRSLKKAAAAPKTQSGSPNSSSLSTPADGKERRGSYFNINTISELPSDPISTPRANPYFAEPFLISDDNSPTISSRDSVFSKWTDTSITTPASTCSIAESTSKSSSIIQTQTLGPSSFITMSTEVTVEPRTPDAELSQLVSEITISADSCKLEPPTPPRSPGVLSSFSVPFDAPVSFFPGPRSPVRPISPSWAATFKPNNPDAWQPPDAWDCVPPGSSATTIDYIMEESASIEENTSISLDLNGMQREMRKMAAASPEVVLLRLREVWGVQEDAALYKELEMEKKRWMLSALHNIEHPDVDTSHPSPNKINAANAQKILALYETQATTSYLAALHHHKQVYHLSPSPLSHTLFPNIHPLLVPTITSSSFPMAPQLFGAVYSLSLPALLASSELPVVLKQVRRCLMPGGTFHLTIIDPLPVTSTLGPKMRAWLDENLLFALERQFRCINPSKLFPHWLHDVGLRAEGSTITIVKFQAMADKSKIEPEEDMTSVAAKETKMELRSLVGRLLWMEVWGAFVAADKWWWEDAECVKECLQLGTYWEYSLIEAVKDS